MKTTQRKILEINELTKKIGKEYLVNQLSFSLNKGDIFGFLGPNGSGKTTTLRMITGLVFPTSGGVFIDGKSSIKNLHEALTSIGSIIENPAFYLNLTAKQNLKLSATLSEQVITAKRIEEVLAIVKLTEAKDEKVKNYSLGMKQRLGLANALLAYPKIIILDEPTNGVDPIGLYEMKELIKDLAKKEQITFLISSHMLREMADLCNKVAIIDRGKLLATGNVPHLLKKHQVKDLEALFFACVKGEAR
ncbi:ABC transporter ATP-binding protein [Enterococcus sp. LJL99]